MVIAGALVALVLKATLAVVTVEIAAVAVTSVASSFQPWVGEDNLGGPFDVALGKLGKLNIWSSQVSQVQIVMACGCRSACRFTRALCYTLYPAAMPDAIPS